MYVYIIIYIYIWPLLLCLVTQIPSLGPPRNFLVFSVNENTCVCCCICMYITKFPLRCLGSYTHVLHIHYYIAIYIYIYILLPHIREVPIGSGRFPGSAALARTLQARACQVGQTPHS